MDLVSTSLYRYIVRCASYLYLSQEDTEDIAAVLIAKLGYGKSDQEFESFLNRPLTSFVRQDVKYDILDFKRIVARRRVRERSYQDVAEDSSALKCSASQIRSERLEQRLTLLTLLQRLPKNQRVCISLRYFDHLDTQEIAARLDITPHAVEKRISRGIKHLRKEWEADDATAQQHGERERSR